MSEVQLDIHTKQDGIGARKPDFSVSRSERSALVSNQAAEHALRTALRNINNMKYAAKQAHDQQVHQFLESISDDAFADSVASEVIRKRLQQRRNSRSLDDVTITSDTTKFPLQKKRDSLKLEKSSSNDEMELPDIQKKSPTDKELRKQAVNGMVKRLSQLSSNESSSCPSSPLVQRRKKVEKLDLNFSTVSPTVRVRASSFTSPTSSPEGRVRTSSFSGSISGNGALPSPRRLRAQVEKNIKSELEAAKREAARRKRLLLGRNGNESWEDQIARDQVERSDRLSSDSEEEVLTSPYSISSSMRISYTAGTFEKQTGKQGLKAWMGRRGGTGTKKT